MVRICWMLIVLVSACKGESTPSGRDCAAVMGPAIDRMLADTLRKAKGNPEVTKTLGELKQAVLTRCREDGWSQAALACIDGAGSNDEARRACERKHLTVEQRDKADAALEAFRPRQTPRTLAILGEFKNRMCACTDQACAEAVMAGLSAYGTEKAVEDAKRGRPVETLTDEETAKSKAITDELTACYTKMSVGSATAPK